MEQIPVRRRRIAPIIAVNPNAVEGLAIVGGPAVAKVQAIRVFSDGKAIKSWPFIANSKLIGLALDEYVNTGTKKTCFYAGSTSRHVHTHYWVATADGTELRYKGTMQSRQAAIRVIKSKHGGVQRVAQMPHNDPEPEKVGVSGTEFERGGSTIKAA